MDADRPLELAERTAERLCHDAASTGQAIASGLDLLREARGDGERDEALDFLSQAVAAQQAKFGYHRRALAAASQPVAMNELRGLGESLFAGLRPSLSWDVAAGELPEAHARILLLLLQVAADALAAGGCAEVSQLAKGGGLRVSARGPRVSLKDEARAGLAGEPPGEGLAARWLPAAFAAALAARAGGRVRFEMSEGRLDLTFEV